MKNSVLDKILRNNRGMLLAYDHGFEHGPTDFDENSVDPEWIMKIADSGHFTGVVFQKGIADKYYDKKKHKVPLIIKMNGKTAYHNSEEPLSLSNCSVEEALELGAKAVGYTIYIGSEHEQTMIDEFAQIEEQAHNNGLAVIGWMYPRGKKIKSDTDKDILAYAARLGLELNADAVKVKYSGDVESFKWVVKSAGKTKVFVVGGDKQDDEDALIKETKDILEAGAVGWAIGRNIWQAKEPIKIAERIAKVLYN
ncbi:MAG: aldolase [Parcubacteria group bacterium CG_4_9_14_0_2_um_filter_41_8]|nr:MAG: aldolase [Parcubacteria group bacterium CG_4_9_14_0_2_um_filter_41_8]